MDRLYLCENDDGYAFCDKEDATYVCIKPNELYGFEKALQIVRNKALLQIDKAKADKHGYTLKRAVRLNYDDKSKGWLLTRTSPYSIKMPLKNARELILKDLIEFYGFQELSDIRGEELLYCANHFEDYRNSKNTRIREVCEFLELYGSVAFEVREFSANLSQGVYEVSYWCTDAF